jgi:hypothetical protein
LVFGFLKIGTFSAASFETCPYGRDDVAADAAYPVRARTYNQTSGAFGAGAQV